MTRLQPILYLPDNKDKNKLEYISNELLKLIGIECNLEIKEGIDSTLVLANNIRIPESKLLSLFDIISLRREFGFAKDIHGRFDQDKIQWDISKPEINEFSRNIKKDLGLDSETQGGKFKVIFTHDIDWISGRVAASMLKLIKDSMGRNRSWITINQVLNKRVFIDTYLQILSLEKEYKISTWNFLLSGPAGGRRYSSRYDIKWRLARELVEIILNSGNAIGLHGSYYASEGESYREEVERLSLVSGEPIIAHRNHYLRFNPDKFYSQLEQAGIKYDFSVGFSSKIGFRAGIANAYNPFNMEKSKRSDVIEIPLVYMERSEHLNYEIGTLEELNGVLKDVKRYNGCVSILFHPESFTIDKRWFGFYEKVIKMVIELGADVSNELPVVVNS